MRGCLSYNLARIFNYSLSQYLSKININQYQNCWTKTMEKSIQNNDPLRDEQRSGLPRDRPTTTRRQERHPGRVFPASVDRYPPRNGYISHQTGSLEHHRLKKQEKEIPHLQNAHLLGGYVSSLDGSLSHYFQGFKKIPGGARVLPSTV